MRRRNIIKFAGLSAALHVAVLAPWPAPSMPKVRAEAILSVGFAAQTLSPAPASTKSASKAAAQKTATKRMQPKRLNLKQRLVRTAADKSVPPAAARTARQSQLHPERVSKLTLNPSPARKGITKTDSPAPMRVARQSDIRVAKASKPEQKSIQASNAIVKIGKRTLARPWPSRRRSVRYHRAKHKVATFIPHPLEPSPGSHFTASGETAKHVPLSHASAARPRQASEIAQAFIRGRLRTNLSRYFWYPAIARRRGWEGNVRVGFTVQPDGRLTNIYVARSSGYDVLDSSALGALRKVDPLTEAASWLNGQAIAIELPVIYKLQEY